jgi:cytochrome oxidase Cu insertion factor (SCO1/SenC/PrrC family)
MQRTRWLAGAAFAGMLFGLLPTGAKAIEVGQKAPDFTLQGTDGKPVKLGDLLGKGPVVIFTFIQAFNGP